MARPPFKLGTRRSPLAMAQAEEVRAMLATAHDLGSAEIEIVPVTSSGDRIQDRPLAEIGGKALWTKELDAWLSEGAIDFAVHSAKDVETHRPAGIAIAAILKREDVRDMLVGADSIAALPKGAKVGTSAPRRAAQLLHARPDCTVIAIRGNVATRLAKLAAGEAHATFLAAAGLKRLGQAGTGRALDARDWLPAPGQAAILVECRAGDTGTRALLAAIDHAPSHRAVIAERALLAALGGDCHSPVAVLTEHKGEDLLMRAALFSPDGVERVYGELRLAAGDSEAPARLAKMLLDNAPPAIAASFTGPRENSA